MIEASYEVGKLYTALLPSRVRTVLGAYYTPPILADRLLDLAASAGADWSAVRVLDPACGGGAFLVPLANRVLHDHRLRRKSPEDRLRDLERRLVGIEIDSFAAWLTRALLQLLVYSASREAGRRLNVEIHETDALQMTFPESQKFDLVIANPPFGRVGLSPEQRLTFRRSLYGHANLYGLFLDLALRWRSSRGFLAFITPTSFLGGQYYSKLRDLLLYETPPLFIDIVEARTGIFDDVQQEMCLTVFGPNESRTTAVHLLRDAQRQVMVERAGMFSIASSPGSPWLLPRTPLQARSLAGATTMRGRLHHLGYKTSTGPLVWNRHKDQLRKRPGEGTFPLIWAEAVRRNRFDFSYRARAAAPFFRLKKGQEHLVCTESCVLVQRTTAKEQERRLIACAVPGNFLKDWHGIVVENHVNIIRMITHDAVPAEALAAVLNTKTVDQVFRCLSGTVAVSVTELHALPLPKREVFDRVAEVLTTGGTLEESLFAVEKTVAEAYGISEKDLCEPYDAAVA